MFDEDAGAVVTESDLIRVLSQVLLPSAVPVPPLLKWIAQYTVPLLGTYGMIRHPFPLPGFASAHKKLTDARLFRYLN